MKIRFLSAIIAVLIFSIYSCASTGGKTAVDTVSLAQAMTDATAALSSTVSDKTEIVIVAIKTLDSTLEDFLTAELTTYLTNSGKFIVLERGNALKAVNDEKNFQLSGLVSDESAVSIGNYLGAKVVVTGTFDLYNGFNQLRLRAVDVRSSQLLVMVSSRIHPRDNMLAGVIPKNAKTEKIQEQTLDHLNRSRDFYQEEKYDEAISELDEAIRLDPKSAEAYASRADIYYVKEDYHSAIADYNEAIRFNRNNPEWYIWRAFAYSRLKDEDAAIASLIQAIRALPNSAELYSGLGLSYSSKGDEDKALENYAKAIRLNPNYLKTYSYRAIIYTYGPLKNYDLAIADYTQIIRRANKGKDTYELDEAYSNRGDVYYYYKEDYDKAIADYTEALRFKAIENRFNYKHHINYNLGGGYKKLGDAYNAKGDYNHAIAEYERAITEFTKCIKLSPNNEDAYPYISRGDAYFAKKDYDSAIADYEEALRIDQNDFIAKDIAKDHLEKAKKARGR